MLFSSTYTAHELPCFSMISPVSGWFCVLTYSAEIQQRQYYPFLMLNSWVILYEQSLIIALCVNKCSWILLAGLVEMWSWAVFADSCASHWRFFFPASQLGGSVFCPHLTNQKPSALWGRLLWKMNNSDIFFPSLWRLGRVARNLLMIQCNTYKSQGLFLDGCGQSFPCMCTYQIQLGCIATWIRRSGDMKSLLMWEFQACINEEKMWLYLKCFLKPHLMLYYKQKKELSTLGMQYR